MPSVQPPIPTSIITKTPLFLNDVKSILCQPWSSFYTALLNLIGANLIWNGSATFNGAATVAVIFDEAQPDASYFVALSGDSNEAFWVTSKTVNGFTLNSSNATSTATVDWQISR